MVAFLAQFFAQARPISRSSHIPGSGSASGEVIMRLLAFFGLCLTSALLVSLLVAVVVKFFRRDVSEVVTGAFCVSLIFTCIGSVVLGVVFIDTLHTLEAMDWVIAHVLASIGILIAMGAAALFSIRAMDP